MPPKTWRTLSTKVATPFRKLSFSERSRSRSPSRQGSTDIPRSDSPVPGDLPRSRVASDAPAPVLDTITTKPPVDKDAVDLDSPTGSAKEPPIDTPPDPKPQEVVDLAPKEDKPVEVTAHEPPAEPNHVVYHAEPDELHHEHPAVEEQHSQVHQQAAPATKVESKVVQFSEAPVVPAADDGSEGSEVKLDDEFDLKNAPEPPSAGSDDSRDFNALMGDQNDVWADEGDGDVTISSPPVDRRFDRLELRRPIQIKGGPITPELTPKEELAEEQSAASEDAASVHPEQVDQPIPSANVDQRDETRRESAGETTLDAHAESPTRAVPPQSAGVESTFAKPYTIAPVSAFSHLSNTQAIADDDDHDGTFVVRSDNQPLARVASTRQKPYNLELIQWTTYTLPSGETYYHHPEARVVTDVDIVLPSNLGKVCEHLDQTIQAHHHHHRANHVAVGRLIDDTSPPNTAALAKSEPESRDYRFSASRDDQVGTEIWLRTVQGQETFAPMTLWVDHLARTVAINPPWEQVTKGDGFDDSDEFDSTLRYWDFIESHPAHTGLPAGSSEEAMEALSWCYTDWLLNPLADPRRQPFSIEECRELLTLLKTLEAQSIGPLQTHIAAKIHVRLTKHRQALNRVLESEVVHNPTSTYKASKDPFGNLFVKIFVGLFCFGIPYKYVPKDDHRHLPSETDSLLQKAKSGPLLADSPIFAAALTLIAALLITSSVVFLALPDQENAAELSALVSLFFSAASLASSIINLERRSSDTVGDESSTHLHVKRQSHPFVRSLPLVFITWSIIALIAAIYLYVYGVEAFPGHHDGMVLNDILRWVIVAMGATLSFILLISAWVTRRRA